MRWRVPALLVAALLSCVWPAAAQAPAPAAPAAVQSPETHPGFRTGSDYDPIGPNYDPLNWRTAGPARGLLPDRRARQRREHRNQPPAGRGRGRIVEHGADRVAGVHLRAWRDRRARVGASSGGGEQIARDLGLRVTGARGCLLVSIVPLARARVGLYKPWLESIEEGWTRWLLEQYEFPYVSPTDQDLRRGGLKARVDVLIVPDHTAERLIAGHAPGTMPPEYVGGLGTNGVAAIAALDLPVKDVVRSATPDRFYCPGSLVRVVLDGWQGCCSTRFMHTENS